MNQEYQYLIGPLGISILLSLSAAGSCKGMALCGASSTLYADRSSLIITYSYVSMIMISTIFFYSFIIAIIIMNKIDLSYKFMTSIWDITGCILFGLVGFVCGNSMGEISKMSFSRIAQNKKFSISFLISLATVEVVLILAFLTSLLIIYKH